MTMLPTTPPFPDPSSAQADQMIRELYARIQTLETTIRIRYGGDDENPPSEQLRVLYTTPVRMFERFVASSVRVPRGAPDSGHRVEIGILEPKSIVLAVTASLSEAFERPDEADLRVVVGTDANHPDIPDQGSTYGGDYAWRVFFARSTFHVNTLAVRPFKWVGVNMIYPWDDRGDNRQGVGRLLQTRTRILAEWEGEQWGTGADGTVHIRVLYVDGNRGTTTMDSLSDKTLLSPIPIVIPER